VYNTGFVGVGKDQNGIRFTQWWRRRLEDFCYEELEAGIFVDQKWMDLAPALFDRVKILRDPTYHVATWNLTHRRVTGSHRTALLVNGRPVVFYHFSGLDMGNQLVALQKYGSEMPALFELRNWYLGACAEEGQQQLSSVPWSYDTFDNGDRILHEQRRLYRDREDLQIAFADPFSTQPLETSYLHWYRSRRE
jgi:hypothetical protein